MKKININELIKLCLVNNERNIKEKNQIKSRARK